MANNSSPIKPAALSVGDQVMLLAPSHAICQHQLRAAIARLQALQLKVKVAENILDRYGYFAGSVEKRAQDINNAFADPSIKAIIAVRGGSGCSLLLEHLDFNLIAQNPKILLGFSDVTALLVAIYHKTGLITFHGPGAASQWPQYTIDHLKSLLFANKQTLFCNPTDKIDDLIPQPRYPIRTIQAGKARGRILGGNLTVLSTMMGSPYLPQDWQNTILFIEDIGEAVYRIDRVLAQLKNAGILAQLSGFIGGKFLEVTKSSTDGFTLDEVLDRYFKPLQIPAFSGAMIGHHPKNIIIPEGITVEMDADLGKIRMLENALR